MKLVHVRLLLRFAASCGLCSAVACATESAGTGERASPPAGLAAPSARVRCSGQLDEFTRLDACFHMMEETGVEAPPTLVAHRHYTLPAGQRLEAALPRISGDFVAVMVADTGMPPEFRVGGGVIEEVRQSFFEPTELGQRPCPLRTTYIIGVDSAFTFSVRFAESSVPRAFVVEDVSADCR